MCKRCRRHTISCTFMNEDLCVDCAIKAAEKECFKKAASVEANNILISAILDVLPKPTTAHMAEVALGAWNGGNAPPDHLDHIMDVWR